MRKLVLLIPKPVLFGLLGAWGCLMGWALGEPLLSLIKPAPRSADAGEKPAEVAPVLVFNNVLEQRLKREEAQSGDVRISLMWDNANDLDLHCVDPRGERIFFNHKRSRSGGELDVDMNAQPPFSREPVENIYWPKDGAPPGKYRVEVNHYAIHDKINTTKYTVGVKHGNTVREFNGQVANQEMNRVYEFDMVPEEERVRTLVDVRTQRPQVSLTATLVLGVWTALLAVAASVMLVGGQNFLMRRPFLNLTQLRLAVGGGAAAGMVSGVVSQYLFSFIAALLGDRLQEMQWLLKAGQVIGWGLLGLLLGFGMGFFIPNLHRVKAGLAGFVGGVVGALAFLAAIAATGELAGRFIGTAMLGFAIGLVVALVERLAREAALVVHFDPHERTVLNLGPDPVILGSGREVHLYLPKERGFPEVTALVTFRNGVVEMDNRLTGKTHTLQGGNKLEIGSLMIEIQTDAQA
jgi:hypothetical protein